MKRKQLPMDQGGAKRIKRETSALFRYAKANEANKEAMKNWGRPPANLDPAKDDLSTLTSTSSNF